MRKVFINGIGRYLHDHKNASFPMFPFYIRAYKFSRVKGAEDFVKDLEVFHFWEKCFARNDSRKKVIEHCRVVKIRFEYAYFFNEDEKVFILVNNIN